jgi:peptide/nickel transport system permease protein
MLIKRFMRNKMALLGLVVVVFVVLTSLTASLMAPSDPLKLSLSSRIKAPSKEHVFGTDHFGRDILSRILYGGRVSLKVGVLSAMLASIIGILLGATGGYFGGRIDYVIVLILDALMSFPSLLLAIGLMAVMGPGGNNIIIAMALSGIPTFGRVVRGSVLSIRQKEYIEAARNAGSGDLKIIFLHVLPNTMAPLIVVTTMGVAGAILTEAALSFLGLGVPGPAPSWGNILADGRNYISQAPWLTIFPGLAITITVLGFNTLGDGLRDVLDPKLKQ